MDPPPLVPDKESAPKTTSLPGSTHPMRPTALPFSLSRPCPQVWPANPATEHAKSHSTRNTLQQERGIPGFGKLRGVGGLVLLGYTAVHHQLHRSVRQPLWGLFYSIKPDWVRRSQTRHVGSNGPPNLVTANPVRAAHAGTM